MKNWPKITKHEDITIIEGVNNISFFLNKSTTKIFLKSKDFDDFFKLGKYKISLKCENGEVKYGII